MFTQYIAETEHRSRHGHIGDLYRDAEVHRLVQQARSGARRPGFDLARPAAWVAAKLAAAGTRVTAAVHLTLWTVHALAGGTGLLVGLCGTDIAALLSD